ncbi:hypothetical protein CK203_000356 [Vitis vinifera]|uniref:Uncharacterized protein n=1 Tax=Vitis vinifera TaxID=29760 RepID=A0A438KR25_VITVI|nr:hypothetical protein CK203_000356 [Vitis vinifera]
MAYRTTPERPTGNTPFALTYGMDAVIPTEIGLPTIRTDAAKQNDANTELRRNLDWADEVRESAAIRTADYQQRASTHYNHKVKPINFKMQTPALALLFALLKAAANLLSTSFQLKPRSGVVSPPPSAGPSHLLPHAGGPPSIPPGSLPQPSPPEGLHCPLRAVDKLASASSNLKRNWSSLSLRRVAKALM